MERGQITIPKKFREMYGIKKDTELDFLPLKEGLLIVKRNRELSPFKEVFGILQKNEMTDEYIEDTRGR